MIEKILRMKDQLSDGNYVLVVNSNYWLRFIIECKNLGFKTVEDKDKKFLYVYIKNNKNPIKAVQNKDLPDETVAAFCQERYFNNYYEGKYE